MIFTPAELAYLRDEQIGRLATLGPDGDPQIRPVGVHLGPDETTIDIVGHALSKTQKWRNVIREPQVAFIVDIVISVNPPKARGIEIRGIGTVLPGAGSTEWGLSGDIIRIIPRRIVAWGLDSPGTTARNVDSDRTTP
ncbi:PPOX class F420-dependent oxidoreductase [Mycolicibacter sinensis]|uniref:Pyridoxamine 5'-phosphate oxidase n=1 Tax=Mycolicibacter sinensis (strain JDM601) TaxID=875328 RepID=A0A1A3U613_MYCSD|nr:PPOX class F420-dependent oxidoreductase [Mycolicibacter sinensis]OBK90107.1 pyridoxamine 5'-phosphate oxidase [Mycolicibacter sinensis]